jgi:hypothetical protein
LNRNGIRCGIRDVDAALGQEEEEEAVEGET